MFVKNDLDTDTRPMRLSRYTDYSLRVLIHAGVHHDRLITIGEIAECHAISRNHIMKVVYELGRLGHVQTIRGKHGGIRLGRPAEEINIGRLIRQTESDLALAECFGSQNRCRLTPACVLKGVLGEALAAFLNVLDRYTLADLVASEQAIRDVLDSHAIAS